MCWKYNHSPQVHRQNSPAHTLRKVLAPLGTARRELRSERLSQGGQQRLCSWNRDSVITTQCLRACTETWVPALGKPARSGLQKGTTNALLSDHHCRLPLIPAWCFQVWAQDQASGLRPELSQTWRRGRVAVTPRWERASMINGEAELTKK